MTNVFKQRTCNARNLAETLNDIVSNLDAGVILSEAPRITRLEHNDDLLISWYEGEGDSYTLLYSGEHTISSESETEEVIDTLTIAGISDANAIIYARVRDKAGLRANYFFGSDIFFENYCKAEQKTTTLGGHKYIYFGSNSGELSHYAPGITANYGVVVNQISNDGTDTVNIVARYGSSYSKTIDGTFTVEIYKMPCPGGKSPFDSVLS